MQFGDGTVRDIHFIRAKMHRAAIAMLEPAASVFPLEGVEGVIRPLGSTQILKFIDKHPRLSACYQNAVADKDRHGHDWQCTHECDYPPHFHLNSQMREGPLPLH